MIYRNLYFVIYERIAYSVYSVIFRICSRKTKMMWPSVTSVGPQCWEIIALFSAMIIIYADYIKIKICTVIYRNLSAESHGEYVQSAFWSSLSFQFRQRIKLWNQSPVWSDLLTVGSGCSLIDIRTESPRESCCLLFPSKDTQALLLASSGTYFEIIYKI